MFPDSSDLNIFSTYVPTCMSFPLPVVPRSSTPATSLANLKWKQPFNVGLFYNYTAHYTVHCMFEYNTVQVNTSSLISCEIKTVYISSCTMCLASLYLSLTSFTVFPKKSLFLLEYTELREIFGI